MPGTALDVEETAAALTHYRGRAVTQLCTGGVLLAGLMTVQLTGADRALRQLGHGAPVLDTVQAYLTGLSVVLLAVGAGALLLSRRMRRALGAGPWTPCAAAWVSRGPRAAATVLRDPVLTDPVLTDPSTGDLLPLIMVASRRRLQLAAPGPAGLLWWCGDPRTGGVLAPPGGGELLWARPVRGLTARQRLARRAVKGGLTGGADDRRATGGGAFGTPGP